MAETPTPYIRKEPGDIMLAADWNEIQVRARTELRTHDHTGDATRIPRDGIADKAIDGSKVDPDSKLSVKSLGVAGPLKVTGTSQLADIQATLASLAGDLGVGTDTPENGEGWDRVVDIVGAGHAKLSIRAGGVDGRVMTHTSGIYSAEPGLKLICFLGGFLPLAFLFPSGWFALQSPTRSLAERLSGTRLVYD